MKSPVIIKNSFERISYQIASGRVEASKQVAREIADQIAVNNEKGNRTVLGLATGNSPLDVYKELVRIHREEHLSFRKVVTFNLDEYYPISNASVLSYNHFMKVHFFDHVDIELSNVHIPSGELDQESIADFCEFYEDLIDRYGGIDIQLLGIGRSGHIGFNEPPSFFESGTRLVKLDPITISDATREFIRPEAVPRRAITMGIRTIFKAKKVYLLAWGEKKSEIVNRLLEGPISESMPASFLQRHPNISVIIDEEASLELTRVKTPWQVMLCDWDDSLTKRAVIWLGQKLRKPILKLTEDDYKYNDLGDLLVNYQDVHELNVKIFNALQKTITGWPGGKPHVDDTHRPERALPISKRSLIFSPHPDDDVISMGGTFLRLVEQGHEVHVAYQTSGNLAVRDEDALQFVEFSLLLSDSKEMSRIYKAIKYEVSNRKIGDIDSPELRRIKGLIRRSEAASAARFCGLTDKQIHFMNLPFYETGESQKKAMSNEDLRLTVDLLRQIKPHQIFVAGDLRDPHGTHKTCLDVVIKAINELKTQGAVWINTCYLWMYRGAWQEWPIDQIEMAVPLSPYELQQKRQAIFRHQTQKDTPVFPGDDRREFWQRAEDRNRKTASEYDLLGLTEYEALEAFVRYSFL